MVPENRANFCPSLHSFLDSTGAPNTLIDHCNPGEGLVNVYQSILEWVEKRPLWLRDCLRRLVIQDRLSAADVADLALLCKLPHGLADGPQVAAQPITAQHIQTPLGSAKRVSITGIEETLGINGLTPGQTLKLSLAGLTVIYGDNAAGKSGYARVLKRLCRARGGGSPVKPDAFSTAPVQAPAATIKFDVGGTQESFRWSEGAPGPGSLSSVSVFDSSCASIYVESQTDLAFVPAGLDLFAKLAKASEQVAAVLQNDIKLLDAKKKTFVGFSADTKAGKAVAGLSCDTKIEDIEAFAIGAQVKTAEIPGLKAELAQLEANDPKKLAREARLKASRLQTVVDATDAISNVLGDAAIATLKARQDEYIIKKQAAKVASEELFKGEPLNGIGSEVWNVLWDAARKYSELQAYPGKSFPNLEDDAHCVLCQQPLSEGASARLSKFDRFISEAAHKAAKDLEPTLFATVGVFKRCSIPDLSAVIAELDSIEEGLGAKVSSHLKSANDRRIAVLKCYDFEDWTQPVPELVVSGVERIRGTVAELQAKAKELDALDLGKELASRRKTLAELEAGQLVLQHKAEIIEEVKRLKRRKLFELALKDTATAGITTKSTELTKSVVTKALCDKFEAELRALGMTALPIQLAPVGGARGALQHRINLSSKATLPLDEIASEGEYRTIALAAFLAELATDQSGSALVFDDPVSSLDHTRRRKVAERLVREAAVRQVVIFTHDIAFVMLINEAFSKSPRISRSDSHIVRKGQIPGFCIEGLPWGGMTAEQRVRALKNDAQTLKSLQKTCTDAEYAAHIGQFYGSLQEAWERAIEGVLFNNVVNRVERPIHTLLLKPVDVVETDYDAVLLGVGTCSKWRDGHDEPGEINEPYPSPDDALADVMALDKWIRAIRERRDLKKLKAKDAASSAPGARLSVVGQEKPPTI